MRWLKVDAAREYAGGVSRKTICKAVNDGKLRVARIGAGRNWVTSTEWLDQWLTESSKAAA